MLQDYKYAPIIWLCVLFCYACKSPSATKRHDDVRKWHTLELTFEGPQTSELAEDNPFLNYRLDVTFSNGESSYLVPGFYAADGNAAETSADSGNKWMVRFTPDKLGLWTYEVSFKKGKSIAIMEDLAASMSGEFMDSSKGAFTVIESDKSGIDNRAKGRLKYIGEPYLRFEENQEYFIKVGVDAPENLLAFEDIDATSNVFGFRKKWEAHARDYQQDADDLTWQGGRGKNLLGAINYLASEGLNVFSFLTFNVDGDDRNIFPYLLSVPGDEYEAYASQKKNKEAWVNYFHRTRFDVSKLEQWERIFEYGDRKGMFLHFKTHETETDHLMDDGVFGDEGRLYYRELIARFGHHLAMNWNLGEENNQPISEVVKVAEYISKLDPYGHHMVIHTFPRQDDRYSDLIGKQSPLTGASLQLSAADFLDVHDRVLKWRMKSDSTGRRWALSVDEPGKANIALLPDDEDPEHDLARSNALWGTLMAGGYGVEWYFGYDSPNSDLTCQDFRSRDLFWDQNRHARDFFEDHLPFWKMQSADHLTKDEVSYCFMAQDQVYAIYLKPETETTSVDIGNSGKVFSVKWFDPKKGGQLQAGSVTSATANGTVDLGLPPIAGKKDWLVLLK